MNPPENMHAYYTQGGENQRLTSAWGQLEFTRSCRLLERALPPAPAQIADIGGGPGSYAAWLAGRGYAVELIDPIPLHVEQATGLLADFAGCGAQVGDARALPLDDQSQDAVLLMGPLYHLGDAMARRQALSEARRVLKPGGVVFVTAISRFSYLLTGLWNQQFEAPEFAEQVRDGLETGLHTHAPGKFIATAYYHRPEGLLAEVRAAGFVQAEVAGIEGPAWLMPNLPELQAQNFSPALLELLESIEHEPEALAMSNHLMATGFRPVPAAV